ncbi:MAG: hypothetical protein Edafosvirus27_5 [Edafosvirus sp.]|uniref:GPI inositol-deacylase PGAP1-like alpha/beta domain-containing protein n=1 Tax=Edafosvirus sp. TaxID=2487765 RepID=A0A3G4ZUZ3_9VIRU|nr:MAG: hypothetical protein Edafosvirus27_5 [Edafosvirus sp.]
MAQLYKSFISFCGEVSTLLPALALLGEAAYKKKYNISFDPQVIKKDKIPILLLHGKGYNQIEWKFGRKYLEIEKYGSVFSLDYDGLASNTDGKTIEDYAVVVGNKILEIQKLTGMNEIVLIGHSLGGLVATAYAEDLAEKQNIIVKHVITIATPFHEPPLVHYFKNWSILFKQMMEPYLIKLREKAINSINKKIRSYHTIDSVADFEVPSPCGSIDCKIQNHMAYTWFGHNVLVVHPTVWNYISDLLDKFVYVKL